MLFAKPAMHSACILLPEYSFIAISVVSSYLSTIHLQDHGLTEITAAQSNTIKDVD